MISNPKVQPRALRPKDAARAYGVCGTSIYALLKSGKLASVKVGGARLILVDSLEAMLAGAAK